MTKIYTKKINECFQCPYFETPIIGSSITVKQCSYDNNHKTISEEFDNGHIIPSWCPLPDAGIFPEKRLKDLLCCALEGGSNYWYFIKSFNYPNNKKVYLEFPHLDLPFLEGGSLTITAEEMSEKLLNLEAINKGLEIMKEKYPRHYADFITENDDAITGDVFLQCTLYGEVIFG